MGTPGPPDDRRIGAILIEAGAITQGDLDLALRHQEKFGGKLGEILVSLNLASEEDVLRARAMQLGLDTIRLSEVRLDLSLVQNLPLRFLAKRRLLPFLTRLGKVEVAVADPVREDDMEFLGSFYSRPTEARLATEREILSALLIVSRRVNQRAMVESSSGALRARARRAKNRTIEFVEAGRAWREGMRRVALWVLFFVGYFLVSNLVIVGCRRRAWNGERRIEESERRGGLPTRQSKSMSLQVSTVQRIEVNEKNLVFRLQQGCRRLEYGPFSRTRGLPRKRDAAVARMLEDE